MYATEYVLPINIIIKSILVILRCTEPDYDILLQKQYIFVTSWDQKQQNR